MVREVEGIDERKALARDRAEQIHAALGILGARLEPLPWKPAKKAGKATSHRNPNTNRTYPSCVDCGRQFTAAPQYSRDESGAARCREGQGGLQCRAKAPAA